MNDMIDFDYVRENSEHGIRLPYDLISGWDFYPDEDLFPASRKKYRIHGKKNIPTRRPFPIFQMNKSNYFATTVINSFAVYHEDKQCKNEIIDVKINNNNCTKPCA